MAWRWHFQWHFRGFPNHHVSIINYAKKPRKAEAMEYMQSCFESHGKANNKVTIRKLIIGKLIT